MNSIDVIIGILLIIGLVRGFWKGFIIELASLLAIVLGIYGAIYFSFYVSDYLSANFSWNQKNVEVVAFVITLIGIMMLVMLIGKILTKIFSLVALGFINRILGSVFGLLKVVIIVGSVLLLLNQKSLTSDWIPEKTQKTSVLYEPMKNIAELVYINVIHRLSDTKIFQHKKEKEIPLHSIKPFNKDSISLEKKAIPKEQDVDTINLKKLI